MCVCATATRNVRCLQKKGTTRHAKDDDGTEASLELFFGVHQALSMYIAG